MKLDNWSSNFWIIEYYTMQIPQCKETVSESMVQLTCVGCTWYLVTKIVQFFGIWRYSLLRCPNIFNLPTNVRETVGALSITIFKTLNFEFKTWDFLSLLWGNEVALTNPTFCITDWTSLFLYAQIGIEVGYNFSVSRGPFYVAPASKIQIYIILQWILFSKCSCGIFQTEGKTL